MKLSTLVPLPKRESPHSHCPVYHAGNPAFFHAGEHRGSVGFPPLRRINAASSGGRRWDAKALNYTYNIL